MQTSPGLLPTAPHQQYPQESTGSPRQPQDSQGKKSFTGLAVGGRREDKRFFPRLCENSVRKLKQKRVTRRMWFVRGNDPNQKRSSSNSLGAAAGWMQAGAVLGASAGFKASPHPWEMNCPGSCKERGSAPLGQLCAHPK